MVLDDGWGGLDAPLPARQTVVTDEQSRSIISTNDSPDVPFDQSVNPYKGCEHGCIYCYARPTHAWIGLSPGLDFETRLTAKPEAAALLRKALSKKGYVPSPICLGANTDAYQPIERERRITRSLLEVLRDFQHPVGIVTKSALVTRDIDLLAPMAEKGLAHVLVSVTTLDPKLARTMEPRAAAPGRRIETIRALADAGVPVGVLASPMIPALNDHELEAILEAAAAAGARAAGTIPLRLPLELAELFTEWLQTHHPLRAAHVLSRQRDIRNGTLNDARFGSRMRGEGVMADLLEQRFHVARRRFGLDGGLPEFRLDLFRVPQSTDTTTARDADPSPQVPPRTPQLSLFSRP